MYMIMDYFMTYNMQTNYVKVNILYLKERHGIF